MWEWLKALFKRNNIEEYEVLRQKALKVVDEIDNYVKDKDFDMDCRRADIAALMDEVNALIKQNEDTNFNRLKAEQMARNIRNAIS